MRGFALYEHPELATPKKGSRVVMKDETGKPVRVSQEELDEAKSYMRMISYIDALEKIGTASREDAMAMPNKVFEIVSLLGLSKPDRERKLEIEMATAIYGTK